MPTLSERFVEAVDDLLEDGHLTLVRRYHRSYGGESQDWAYHTIPMAIATNASGSIITVFDNPYAVSKGTLEIVSKEIAELLNTAWKTQREASDLKRRIHEHTGLKTSVLLGDNDSRIIEISFYGDIPKLIQSLRLPSDLKGKAPTVWEHLEDEDAH